MKKNRKVKKVASADSNELQRKKAGMRFVMRSEDVVITPPQKVSITERYQRLIQYKKRSISRPENKK